MNRLHDAAKASASEGRSLLSLCSLVDRKSSGMIAREELLLTAKMMGCTLSLQDLDALAEILPDGIVGVDGRIDYRELSFVLDHFVPKEMNYNDLESTSRPTSLSRTGALPSYAQAGMSTQLSSNAFRFGEDSNTRQILTPGGMYAASPSASIRPRGGLDRSTMKFPRGVGGADQFGSGLGAYERVVYELGEIIQIRMKEKSRGIGAPFSLLRMFESVDNTGTGYVSKRTFQAVLDDIGVALNAQDLLAIDTLYGRVEDDRVCYEALCNDIGDNGHDRGGGLSSALGATGTLKPRGGGGGLGFGATNRLSTTRTLAPGQLEVPTAQEHRLLHRVRELRVNGIDLRETFRQYDVENLGLVIEFFFCFFFVLGFVSISQFYRLA